MLKPITILMVMTGMAALGNAQTVALFTVDQPQQFIVNAGEDQTYFGSALTLGGQPTAIGGGGDHSFVWEPAELLDDPNASNPVVQELTATTVFTVTVTDLANGCIKVGEVEVVYGILTSLSEVDARWCRFYPNPAGSEVWMDTKEDVVSINLCSLTGQELVRSAYPAFRPTRLDLGQVPEGMYVLTVSLASGQLINHKLCKVSSVR